MQLSIGKKIPILTTRGTGGVLLSEPNNVASFETYRNKVLGISEKSAYLLLDLILLQERSSQDVYDLITYPEACRFFVISVNVERKLGKT